MTVVAIGTLAGDEARGNIVVSQHSEGAQITISDLWVSPGAPDAWLYLSPETDGRFTETATELGVLTEGQNEGTWNIPLNLDLSHVRTVLVYCNTYSVMFGTATLAPCQ